MRSADRGPEVQLHDAGVRPGEALALEWERVLARTLVVDQAVSLGKEREVKSRNRSVRLLAPLRADLLEWPIASPTGPWGS